MNFTLATVTKGPSLYYCYFCYMLARLKFDFLSQKLSNSRPFESNVFYSYRNKESKLIFITDKL